MIVAPKISIKGFDFQDRTGTWRTIYPCSVLAREALKERINQIWDFVQNYPDDQKPFAKLVEDESKFKFLCLEAFRLAGIDPEWLDFPLWQAMVLPYEDSDDNEQIKPILVQLNFPEPDPDQKLKPGQEPQTLFDLIAAVWTASDSLGEALETVTTVPMEHLEKILAARAKIMEEIKINSDPKARRKKDAKDKLMDQQNAVYANLPDGHPMKEKWKKYSKGREHKS